MRMIDPAPHAIVLELTQEDCLQMYLVLSRAHRSGSNELGDLNLCGALATGLLAAAYAAYLRADDDPPATIAHLWAIYGPRASVACGNPRVPVPPDYADPAAD